MGIRSSSRENTSIQSSSNESTVTEPSKGRNKKVDFAEVTSTSEDDGKDVLSEENDTDDVSADTQIDGPLSWVMNSIKSWWMGKSGELENTENDSSFQRVDHLKGDFHCSLRIQPFGRFVQEAMHPDRIALKLSRQPCNVYIKNETFLKHLKSDNSCKDLESGNNVSFLARITYLPSPVEREQIMKKKMEKSSQRLASVMGSVDDEVSELL